MGSSHDARSDESALRLLLAFAVNPTLNNQESLWHDWRAYPILHRLTTRLRRQPLHSAGSQAKKVLKAGIASAAGPTEASGFPSPIHIVGEHTFGELGWEGIADRYTRPNGQKRSIRWFKNYKNQGLAELLNEWRTRAETSQESRRRSNARPQAKDPDPATTPEPPVRALASRKTGRQLALWGTVALLILSVGLAWALRSQNPLNDAPDDYVGIALGADHRTPEITDLCPNVTLPETGFQRETRLILPTRKGRALLIGNWRTGHDAGRIGLWHPREADPDWITEGFQPTCEETRMYPHLPAGACEEPYGVRALAHGGKFEALDDRVAAVYWQGFGPTFILFLDKQGARTGSYAHPGQISNPVVLDTNGDGTSELVLAGEDNALDRPVLVALDARMPRGAASSVAWNKAGESALVRVLLPGDSLLAAALKVQRLRVPHFGIECWRPETQGWRVRIGSAKTTLFYAYLDKDFNPLPEPLAAGYHTNELLLTLGLDPDSTTAALADSIRVIRGTSTAVGAP